jgi:hypothetical protein
MQPVPLYEEKECKAAVSQILRELTGVDDTSPNMQNSSNSVVGQHLLFCNCVGRKSFYNEVQYF